MPSLDAISSEWKRPAFPQASGLNTRPSELTPVHAFLSLPTRSLVYRLKDRLVNTRHEASRCAWVSAVSSSLGRIWPHEKDDSKTCGQPVGARRGDDPRPSGNTQAPKEAAQQANRPPARQRRTPHLSLRFRRTAAIVRVHLPRTQPLLYRIAQRSLNSPRISRRARFFRVPANPAGSSIPGH